MSLGINGHVWLKFGSELEKFACVANVSREDALTDDRSLGLFLGPGDISNGGDSYMEGFCFLVMKGGRDLLRDDNQLLEKFHSLQFLIWTRKREFLMAIVVRVLVGRG